MVFNQRHSTDEIALDTYNKFLGLHKQFAFDAHRNDAIWADDLRVSVANWNISISFDFLSLSATLKNNTTNKHILRMYSKEIKSKYDRDLNGFADCFFAHLSSILMSLSLTTNN